MVKKSLYNIPKIQVKEETVCYHTHLQLHYHNETRCWINFDIILWIMLHSSVKLGHTLIEFNGAIQF